MTFEEWLKFGKARGWVSDEFCYHHSLLPCSPEEQHQINESGEPDKCITVTRLYQPASADQPNS